MNILVNLPAGFFTHPALAVSWARLETLGDVQYGSCNTADEIAPVLAAADSVLMWSWPVLLPELLDKTSHLRFAGHLDVVQAGARAELEKGLAVSVSRGGFSPAVAEMALALILSSLRRVSEFHAQMRTGTEAWVSAFPDDIDTRERELSGMHVGIVGFGGVGRRLAQLLAPFDVTLRVVDPFVPQEYIAAAGGQCVELNAMLDNSDVVVLCAASNTGTAHLLGAEEIARLRPDALLVNVARAALVNTSALVKRLQQNDLFAAVDVFDREPLEKNAALRSLPNAFLTPHRAGGLISSVRRIVDTLIDDLQAFQEGRPRRFALTPAMLSGLDA